MKKNKKSRFGFVVLLVIFVYFAYIFAGQQETLFKKGAELDRINEKINEEEKENEKLAREQEQINSDEYIEKIAREKLGMVKKGERVYYDIGK